MTKNRLLKSQKNDVLESIQKAGLDPRVFTWEQSRSDYFSGLLVSTLRFRSPSSTFYFKFDIDYSENIVLSGPRPTIRRSKFSPGSEQMTEELESNGWPEQRTHVAKWLMNLKREVQTLDLWEQLKEYPPDTTFVGTTEMSNAPFSYSETENIIGALDNLRVQIEENFNLHGEQLAFVKKQIEYLKDGAKRQGRKDWIHTFIGVTVTIATGLALSPEKAKLLWDLVRSCFAVILPLPAP